jgi:hypothetical protein
MKKRTEFVWDKPADITRSCSVGANIVQMDFVDSAEVRLPVCAACGASPVPSRPRAQAFSVHVQVVEPQGVDALALQVRQQRSVPPEQSRAARASHRRRVVPRVLMPPQWCRGSTVRTTTSRLTRCFCRVCAR